MNPPPVYPPRAWMETYGRGTRVVVLDTRYEAHLPHVIPIEVRNFLPSSDRPESHHANYVSQVVASSDPIAPGMARSCELYVGEVVGQIEGWPAMRAALDWAIALRPDVVNMSFACPQGDHGCSERIRELDRMGAICVASHNPYLHWPHSLDYVLAVGCDDKPHDGCDLLTWGKILVRSPESMLEFKGSSAASAVIAGVAACAKSLDRGIGRPAFIDALNRLPRYPPSVPR